MVVLYLCVCNMSALVHVNIQHAPPQSTVSTTAIVNHQLLPPTIICVNMIYYQQALQLVSYVLRSEVENFPAWI